MTQQKTKLVENKTLSSVLLIYKKSRYDLYFTEKQNAHYQMLEESGHDAISRLKLAHKSNSETIELVKKTLEAQNIEVLLRYRADVKKEDANGRYVITVGGDGTLLDASSRVINSRVLGVNSDVETSVGFLCAAHRDNFSSLLQQISSAELEPRALTRLSAQIDGETLRPILNDVLITNKNPAATSRFVMTGSFGEEVFKSSGVWVSTAAGSTAAMRSAGGRVQELSDDRMQVRVREPYWPGRRQSENEHFFVKPGQSITIESRMRNGAVYCDGPHRRFDFTTGQKLVLSPDGPKLNLVVSDEMITRRNALFLDS